MYKEHVYIPIFSNETSLISPSFTNQYGVQNAITIKRNAVTVSVTAHIPVLVFITNNNQMQFYNNTAKTIN